MPFAPIIRGQNRLEVLANGDCAELVLIGAIGKSWFDDSGITEQEVRDALNEIPKGKRINARINSEGGSVKEGLGIYNAFKERSGDITAYITGYALSIASIFPLGAGKVISPKSAIWMMHRAFSFAQGNSDEMRLTAEMLDAHDETLVDIYASETGKTKTEIRDAMEAETWIKGGDAVNWGLADQGDSEDDSKAEYRKLPANYLTRCKAAHVFNSLSAPVQGAANQPAAVPPQLNTTMNKKLIVALLKKHNIEALEADTDEQLLAKLEKIPATAAIEPNDKLAIVEAKIEAQETRRLTAIAKQYVAEFKITNEEVPIFVGAMKTDEAGTIKILDARLARDPGGSPIGGGGSGTVRVWEAPKVQPGQVGYVHAQAEEIINIRKEFKDPQAQFRAVVDNWSEIIHSARARDAKAGRMEVMAANTITTFTTSFLLTGSLTALQNVWAPLKALAIEYDPDPYKPLASAVLKNPTAFGTFATDATNFTTNSNSTVGGKTVTMHQYTQPFQVSNTDLNSGLRMQDLVVGNQGVFANGVIDVVLTPVTAANFTATPLITTAGAFGFSDSATLQGQLQKAPIKNLIIDGTLGATLMNTPAFFQRTGTNTDSIGGSTAFNVFGWDILALNSRWSGAGTNIKGFACHPQAIIGVHGVPLTPVGIPGGIFSYQDSLVPQINITIRTYMWFDVNTRTMYCSYDLMLGVAAGDITSGVVIAIGTPS